MIAVVIVTYNPEPESLAALLKSLAAQTDRSYIVDNSDSDSELVPALVRAAGLDGWCAGMIRFGENRGLGVGLNEGIRLAIDEGADYLLLSDQDSLPAVNMVEELFRVSVELERRGVAVGAVGPSYTDLHTRITYPFQTSEPGKFFYSHRKPSSSEPVIEAITLITSGTLIPARVLLQVGFMRDDFFIDYIDIEWCHRARAKGYRLFGVGSARMYQRMGESALRVWWLRWRSESAYSPIRIYYRVRNFFALCRLSFIDWRWKVRSAWYVLGVVYSHVVFGARKLGSLRMGLIGAWHGLIGRSGRF